MVDYLPPKSHDRPRRRLDPGHRLLAVALVALVALGGAVIWRVGASRPSTEQAKLAAPRNPVLDELLDSTKALGLSQQQAVDQLQELQDLVRTQQADLKRASDRVAALNARLDTLQQSFASLSPPMAETATPEKAEPVARPRRPAARAKASARSPRGKKTRTAKRR